MSKETGRRGTDGTEALAVIRDHGVPGLIITDVSMPLMNGYELTSRLRAARHTAGVPIIMLSAFSQPKHVLEGYAQGADDYVAKPVEMPVLVAKIEALMRRAPHGRAVRDEPGTIVAFAHAKGGSGATTLAVNCAALLANRGERMALLDASVEFAGAAIHLDLRPTRSLVDLAGVQPPVDDDIFESMCVTHASGVALLQACDRTERAELVTVPAIQEAIAYLARVADWVIVDCPASLNERTLAVFDAAQAIYLVSGVTLPAMQATAECSRVFAAVGYAEKTSLVVNRTTPGGLSADQAARFFRRPADLVIAYSELFDVGANTGRPPALSRSEAPAQAELRALADHVQDRRPAHAVR